MSEGQDEANDWFVEIRSRPGLSHAYHSVLKISAETEDLAVSMAMQKARKSNPRYKYRTDPKHWLIGKVVKKKNSKQQMENVK